MFVNLKEAFTYMFKDEKFWSKYLIGTLFVIISLIPTWICYPSLMSGTLPPIYPFMINILTIILASFVSGFGILYANSKVTLPEGVLPEWGKDFKKIVLSGLKYGFGGLLYGIASFCVILVIFIILAIIGFFIFGIVASPTISTMGPNPNPMDPVFLSLVIKFGIMMFIIFLPLLILWLVFLILAILSYITDLKFVSFFNFKKMFYLIKNNVLNFLIISVIAMVFTVLFYTFMLAINYHIYFAISSLFSFYFGLVFWNLSAQFVKIGIQKNFERLNPKKEGDTISQES